MNMSKKDTFSDKLLENDFYFYLILTFFGLLFGIVLTSNISEEIVKRTRSSIPGISFSLLGFAITSLSILTSLKTSQYFSLLQIKNKPIWSKIVSIFVQASVFYSIFGIFTILTSDNDFLSSELYIKKVLMSIFFILFLLSCGVTYNLIHLVSLIANTPLVDIESQTSQAPENLTKTKNPFKDS
jgi:hypothetical protein